MSTTRYLWFPFTLFVLAMLSCTLSTVNSELVETAVPPVTVDSSLPMPVSLDLALCEGLTDTRPGVSGVRPGNDLQRVTLQAENATCNDGTPAVMYVRPASNPDQQDKWVFHLQGGGACTDYETCVQRWCGIGSYDAGKMSSQWAPPAMAGKGLFNPTPDNPFHDVNQVFVYYCSSDGWAGQQSAAIVPHLDPANSQQMLMPTQGHNIISAVFDTLFAGATSDNNQATMPSLQEATDVVLTGTSAGAGGVTHHLDWTASLFDSAQTNVYGVIDAGSRPYPEDLADPIVRDNINAFEAARSATGYYQNINPFLDQSCLAHFDIETCRKGTWIHHNHLTTPFFIRMDMGDRLLMRNFQELGGEALDIATATQTRLTLLPNVSLTAVEADAITFTPGVYGPACGQHVGLTSDTWYGLTTVPDVDGMPLTLSSAIQRWLSGESVLAVDTVPPTLSTCEEADDSRD